jgi:HSP20 family molecular chaperone IbpA
MKKTKLEIRIRASRPGVPAEQITIHNEYSPEEAKRRFRKMWPLLVKMAEKHLGAEKENESKP